MDAFDMANLEPSNAGRILVLADKHSLTEWKKVCKRNFEDKHQFELLFQMALAWVVAEKKRFLSDARFKEELEQHPHLLIELLDISS